MKTRTTNEAMVDFIRAAQNYLARSEQNENTKLGYAIQKMVLRLKKAQERLADREQEIQIDNCATDEKGLILKDANGLFEFTKEGATRRNKQLRELRESEIEIEPYFATELPPDLTVVEKAFFDGFVLTNSPESDEPKDESVSQAAVVQ